MPKIKSVFAHLKPGFVIGLILCGSSLSQPVQAAATLFEGPLTLQPINTAASVDDRRQQYADCHEINVQVAGDAAETTVCPRPAAFGWLDSHGVIRYNDGDVYRRIIVPPGIDLLAQPDSDTVLAVDQSKITGPAVELRYYNNFTNHLSIRPADGRLVLDDNFTNLTIMTADYPVVRQPEILSDLNGGRILLGYEGRLGWADLNSKTSGVLQFLPQLNGTYYLPAIALSPDGQTVATSYPTLDGYGAGNNVALWDIDSCSTVTTCQRPLLDYLQAQLPGLRSVDYLRFVDNDTLEVAVAINNIDGNKFYRLSGGGSESIAYLALGDSFASGEGAYQYLNGTDTADNKCHNSLIAYPYLLNPAAVSVACSGALINDVNGLAPAQHTGRTAGSYSYDELNRLQSAAVPGTLNQLSFINYFHPGATTLSIGGNDIGFADILKACINPLDNWRIRTTCYATYEDRKELLNNIRSQYGRLVAVDEQLLRQTDRLYVIGYPQIISDSGSCGVNVLLNDTERVFAVQLTDYLNSVIEAAADTAGAVYVDASRALDGRRLCESSSPAVNGITAGDDMLPIFGYNILGQESFHPNWLGHLLLANAIYSQTADLNAQAHQVIHTPPEITDDLAILQVPKTNRRLNVVRYNQQLIEDVLLKSGAQAIHLLTGPEGFTPNSTVTLSIHSNPVTIGTYPTDENGDLDFQFSLPPAIEPGYHAVSLSGFNRYGEPLTVEKIVYITGDEATLDGALSLSTASVRTGLALISQTAITPSVVK